MRFQVQNTEITLVLAMGLQQPMAEIDHEERQVHRIRHGGLFDIHKIFETPILLGVTKIEFDSLNAIDKRRRENFLDGLGQRNEFRHHYPTQ